LALVAVPVLVRRGLRRAFDDADVLVGIVAIAAILIWNQVRIRPNFGHALQAAWPVWVLLPALCFRAAAWLGQRRRWLQVALAVILVLGPAVIVTWQAVLGSITYAGVIAVAKGQAVRTGWRRADVYLPARLRQQYNEVLRLVAVRGGHVLVLPYGPMIGFLTDVPSPTFITNFLPGRLDEEWQRRVIADLERTKTATVVRNDIAFNPGPITVEEYMPVLWQYIRSRYLEIQPRGGFKVYVRNE
jgi:hypothetical protein